MLIASCRSVRAAGLAAGLLAVGSAVPLLSAASAEDVAPGTVLGRDNLDALRDKTFQGHRIGDLLIPEVEWHIKTHGLALTLTETKPYPPDPAFVAATRKYAPGVALDPASRNISGWVAGVPFPDIDAGSDPDAGLKLIWNMLRGRNRGDSIYQPRTSFVLVDGRTGPDRVQEWRYMRFNMKGRIHDTVPVLGDGRIYEKEINVAMLPQDIKGVGTFTIRYDTGQVNDTWAYVREIRRTRRLSGGSWMEPIGSTDILGDDFGAFNAHPTWYEKFELVGQGTRLVIANSPRTGWFPDAASLADQFPRQDIANPPYFNITDVWEPRRVYVVRGTPKSDHPQSRKDVVIDATTWNAFMNFGYNKEGVHQKTQYVPASVYESVDNGAPVQYEPWAMGVDFIRMHATTYATTGDLYINGPLKEDDVSLSVLEAAGR